MRTVTFKSVLDSVLAMMGQDASTIEDIDQQPYKEIAVHITRRVREGWELAWWPEWTLTELRTIENGGTIGLQQDSQTRIGTVRNLYVNDPRTSPCPQSVPYLIGPSGISPIAPYAAASQLYVVFRKRASRFATTYYDAAETTLQDGNIRYWATATDTQLYGNCYQARLISGAYQWELQELPFVLEQWVILAAYADKLNQDGQRDRAKEILQDDAYPELWRARDAEMAQNGLFESARVLTYGTHGHSYMRSG